MDLDDALEVFGLGRDTTWPEVRATYRLRIRAVHPDVARGPIGRSDAAQLNAAFSALERVYRRGEAPPPQRSAATTPHPPASRPTPTPPVAPPDLMRVDDDALVLEAPADEVFLRLADAIDTIGAVTYRDLQGGYLEAIVGDGTGQLVVSLQGRAFATEAFFTLEPLDSRPAPLLESIVRAIAYRLRNPT